MPTTMPLSESALIKAVATVVFPDLDWLALMVTIGTDRSRLADLAFANL